MIEGREREMEEDQGHNRMTSLLTSRRHGPTAASVERRKQSDDDGVATQHVHISTVYRSLDASKTNTRPFVERKHRLIGVSFWRVTISSASGMRGAACGGVCSCQLRDGCPAIR